MHLERSNAPDQDEKKPADSEAKKPAAEEATADEEDDDTENVSDVPSDCWCNCGNSVRNPEDIWRKWDLEIRN